MNNTQELIEKARRVYQRQKPELPMPQGFTERVLARPAPEPLMILQWTSYAGLAAAVVIALAANWHGPRTSQAEIAGDDWMDIPTSEELYQR